MWMVAEVERLWFTALYTCWRDLRGAKKKKTQASQILIELAWGRGLGTDIFLMYFLRFILKSFQVYRKEARTA